MSERMWINLVQFASVCVNLLPCKQSANASMLRGVGTRVLQASTAAVPFLSLFPGAVATGRFRPVVMDINRYELIQIEPHRDTFQISNLRLKI